MKFCLHAIIHFYRSDKGEHAFLLSFDAADTEQAAAGNLFLSIPAKVMTDTPYHTFSDPVNPAKVSFAKIVAEKFLTPIKYESGGFGQPNTILKFSKVDEEYFDGTISGWILDSFTQKALSVSGTFHVKKIFQKQ